MTIELGEAPLENKVKLADFHRWLESRGRSQRDAAHRANAREILGAK